MDFATAKKAFEALKPQQLKLKAQLKALNQKLRPAKQAIDDHMIDRAQETLQIGPYTFKKKTVKVTTLNKKRLENDPSIPAAAKQACIERNTQEKDKVEVM